MRSPHPDNQETNGGLAEVCSLAHGRKVPLSSGWASGSGPELKEQGQLEAGACKEGSRRSRKKGAIQNTDAGEREACSTYAGTGCEEGD